MVKYYQVDFNIEFNIEKLISFYSSNKKYEIIEYKSNKMNIDYVDKKYPLLSILIPKGQCIFTEIDINAYKYKNISSENIFYIVNPLENSYVVFDSSKFYSGEGIKINIWDEIKDEKEIDLVDMKEIIHENIEMRINLKDKIYSEMKYDIKNKFVKVQNSFIKNDYKRMYEKYGLITDDLIPFIENKDLHIDNRFNRIKLIKNVLSKDVCYWIMNESEKQKSDDGRYSNYSDCVSIENLPGVLNFVLYSSHYWLTHVKQLYDMNVVLNIKDIFISKNSTKSIKGKNNDDGFIILNIQLNETTESLTYNNDNILLNQGDMIVYTKKTMRECANNYVLVLIIDFV